jgi:hypothetical protein
MENSDRILRVRENIDRLRQYNINTDLIGEYESFLLNCELTDNEINTLNKIILRMISQHYVKQLLMQTL